ncbi:carbon-nitrogen hydrolase family protein [Yaniella halotolerans]|uniref:carbon-nitrogen hydrolase family protein n=1 Tax=Yaniella halotolerans TaxID=225453 RepID=UPI0003B55C89|nr:carbon-nitrogen hydrolase family protein [Yaniella halotolerans]
MRFKVALAQRKPIFEEDPVEAFARDVAKTLARYPETGMLVYPELHLHGTEYLPEELRDQAERARAVELDSELVRDLGGIAKRYAIWLCPGSIGEMVGDEFYNTQLLFNPSGELVAHYRKMFPWRPFEPHEYGTEFVVVETDLGRAGLSNCYDAWFPEHSRHLGWFGAEFVLNIVKTISPDREQELILAKANAIVNQNYMLSVNCAAPVGRGRTIAVDPEGYVLGELGDDEDTLVVTIDTDRLARVREVGTRGTNRLWHQLDGGKRDIKLPMYQGRLSPDTFRPKRDRT